MPALQTLRHARTLAWGVLVWFVLSLGAAIASPAVQPQTLNLVCSAAGGVKLVASSDEGRADLAHPALDCVLCLALAAPPATPVAVSAQTLASGAPDVVPPLPLVWRTAAPLPARGPPAA